ncbi:MAG: metallophosphoesterase family protein [Candidatus Hydrogenedentes bacterium]|nr:metallophosphoesterase family protein [Candidatus Hydrogenedentota bacterium]
MNIGVMSDTHGNRQLMHAVADRMVQQHHVELIYHLGDDYSDGQELAMAGARVCLVPGLWCEEYQDWRVPNSRVDEYQGVRIGCAHAQKDLRAIERAADIVMCGHTHVAEVRQQGDSIWLNPGHLKGPMDRNETPSYAVISLVEDAIFVAVYEVDGRMRHEFVFHRKSFADE